MKLVNVSKLFCVQFFFQETIAILVSSGRTKLSIVLRFLEQGRPRSRRVFSF